MKATKTVKQLRSAVKSVTTGRKGAGEWYTNHMAAASRAIYERIPLVDLILEVRDARIPLSTEFEHLRNFPSSSRRIIVMNKIDLANRTETKEWMKYFDQHNYVAYGVNSHNKDNVREFLNFIQARVRDLRRTGNVAHTTSLLVVGAPNVGKSALVNSLHQIGRISASERGKLKHATVSPLPGETKDISSLKVGSHPNIYALDTPGVLPPRICQDEVLTKLALTGAVGHSLIGEKELAQLFLSTLNLGTEYKKWEKFVVSDENSSSVSSKSESTIVPESDSKPKKQYPTDHTQDFIVNNVRGSLFATVSSFDGDLEDEDDLLRLINTQFSMLRNDFHIGEESDEEAYHKVAVKLLNLYRTGRLGHYTLDTVPMVTY